MASLVVLASAVGCAAAHMKDAMRELEESLEAYNEAYRWKNYERAAAFVPADLRAAFLATYEDEDNSLHVEDYKVLNVDMQSETAATVVVRVRYMLLPSVNVEKATLVQHWHRLNGAWTLETEEGSIRELSLEKKPRNPEAFGGAEPPSRSQGETKVKAEGPRGEVLREDAPGEPVDSDDSASPEEP